MGCGVVARGVGRGGCLWWLAAGYSGCLSGMCVVVAVRCVVVVCEGLAVGCGGWVSVWRLAAGCSGCL